MRWRGGATGAESPKDQLVLANHAIAEELGRGLRDIEPLHIFHLAAAVADEVMVAHAFHIETRGAAFYRDFTDEARFNQVAQVAVDGGPCRARVESVNAVKDLRGRRMPGILREEGHHAVTLRGELHSVGIQKMPNRLDVHR